MGMNVFMIGFFIALGCLNCSCSNSFRCTRPATGSNIVIYSCAVQAELHKNVGDIPERLACNVLRPNSPSPPRQILNDPSWPAKDTPTPATRRGTKGQSPTATPTARVLAGRRLRKPINRVLLPCESLSLRNTRILHAVGHARARGTYIRVSGKDIPLWINRLTAADANAWVHSSSSPRCRALPALSGLKFANSNGPPPPARHPNRPMAIAPNAITPP